MKLKNLLKENFGLGELPSSKLMKMKWNPLKESDPATASEKYFQEDEEENLEEAPKLKNPNQKEIDQIKKLYVAASGLKKGGAGNRYGKEFDSAKKRMLKAFNDMLTYAKIGS